MDLYAYCGNGPIDAVDPGGTDGWDAAASFFGGFGNTASFGFTDYINGLSGAQYDKCSGWYRGGQVGGFVFQIGATAGIGGDVVVEKEAVQEGVYVVTTKAGDIYVGQSANIDERLAQHVASGKFTREEVAAARRIEQLGGKTLREIGEQTTLDTYGGARAPGVLNNVNPIGKARQALMGPGYSR